jgi:Ion transport protein
VVLGLQTYSGLAGSYQDLFDTLNHVILGIYVVELLIRLTAFRWKPHEFAKDKWNVFDFVVVVASFLPWLRENAMLLRLVRLMRIVRVIRFQTCAWWWRARSCVVGGGVGVAYLHLRDAPSTKPTICSCDCGRRALRSRTPSGNCSARTVTIGRIARRRPD